jgi:hypothetical protein
MQRFEEVDLGWRDYDIEELHNEVVRAKMRVEVMTTQPDTRLWKTRVSKCSSDAPILLCAVPYSVYCVSVVL